MTKTDNVELVAYLDIHYNPVKNKKDAVWIDTVIYDNNKNLISSKRERIIK